EHRGDGLGILLDMPKRHAEAIALCRQRIAQRAVEPAPGAHRAHRLRLEIGLAAAIEENEGVELDAHGLVEIDADAAQDVDELRMRAQPGATPGELVGVALEHDDVPAGAAQEMCREQPAEPAADHQRTARRRHGPDLCGASASETLP